METNKTLKKNLYMIDPRNIFVVDGFNSRIDFDLDPLCESIKENGVLNPVTVIKVLDEDGVEKFRLVDGERRYRSVMRLIEEGVSIARIPAIEIPEMPADQLIVQQVVRNDGKRFNEYESGLAYDKLLKYGWQKKEIADKLGVNPGMVTYCLGHLTRDKRVIDLINKGTISGTQVRKIYREHPNDEEGAVNEILQALESNKKKEKKTITVADLDINGRTIIARDSDTIRKGIDKLFYYYNKYSNNGQIDVNLDINDVFTSLNKGEHIDSIFNRAINQCVNEAV